MIGKRASSLIRWYLDHSYEKIPIDVYETFRNEFFKELIANAEGVTLPGNLGWMKIVGNRDPAIDHGNTRLHLEEGQVGYCKNFHSDGWAFGITWYSKVLGKTEDIIKKAFFNSDAYGFTPNSTLKKMLHASIMAGNWDHYHKKSYFRAPRNKKVKRITKLRENKAKREAAMQSNDED